MKARNAVCKRDSRVEFFEHVGLDLPAEDTNDFVEYFVSEIERYTPDEALKIIRGRCGKAEGFNAIVLGGVLKKTLLNNWYKDYGYQSFAEMVLDLIQVEEDMVLTYMEVYSAISDGEIPWDKVGHLGWTKIVRHTASQCSL